LSGDVVQYLDLYVKEAAYLVLEEAQGVILQVEGVQE
jgi:hypothetical protein